jgi:hypothetical protein
MKHLLAVLAFLLGHPALAHAGGWAGPGAYNADDLLASIADAEHSRGRVGAAGERGDHQVLPAVRAGLIVRLRARGVAAPTERQIVREHLADVERQLVARGVPLMPFNVALAWNAGAARAASGRAPERSYDYARRVVTLYAARQP